MATQNLVPIANAGADQQVTLAGTRTAAVLDGSASRDPDGAALAFTWSQRSGPSPATIVSPQLAQTLVTTLSAGIYTFELRVTDQVGASARDSVIVTVQAPANMPPIANAGPDMHIMASGPNTVVVLDGSASRDPDGVIAAAKWSHLSGPAGAVIASPNNVQTIVTGLQPGVYRFELLATDNLGANSRDSITVTVQASANTGPVADAGDDRLIASSPPAHAVALLDGSASRDPDGTLVAFRWQRLSGPAATIVTPGRAQTAVTGMQPGQYVFELRVTDNAGASSRDTVTVTVFESAAPSDGPIAHAGRDVVIVHPVTSAVLDGSASKSPDGTLVRFDWEQVGGPAAGCAVGHDHPRLALTKLVRGIYRYRLTVTDARRRSASDEVTVTVRSSSPTR